MNLVHPCKSVSRMSQRCFKSVSWVIMGVQKVVQGHLMGVCSVFESNCGMSLIIAATRAEGGLVLSTPVKMVVH